MYVHTYICCVYFGRRSFAFSLRREAANDLYSGASTEFLALILCLINVEKDAFFETRSYNCNYIERGALALMLLASAKWWTKRILRRESHVSFFVSEISKKRRTPSGSRLNCVAFLIFGRIEGVACQRYHSFFVRHLHTGRIDSLYCECGTQNNSIFSL
jgi:hypothetical protein